MNCLECQDLLQQRLDGDTIASEVLEQHLSQCTPCREQHAAALRLLEGLKELPKPRADAGHARSIAAEIMRDRRHRRDHWRRRVFVTTALAASVVILLLLANFWLPRTPQQGLLLTAEPLKVKVDVPPDVIPEPRSPLTPYVDRFVGTTRDHAKVVMVAANLNAMENLPAVNNLPPIDPGIREAGQEVTDGVRLVTRNARRALDFFARELPMPELGEKNE